MWSWRPVALRLSPAASSSWTVACLTRVRSAKRCPLGQGEPDGSSNFSASAAGWAGPGAWTCRQPRWSATHRSAASLRLCQRCHRSATCTACGAPAVAPSVKKVRDRGRPPRPQAASRAKRPGWTPPGRAGGPLDAYFRRRPGQSRSDALCGSRTHRRRPPAGLELRGQATLRPAAVPCCGSRTHRSSSPCGHRPDRRARGRPRPASTSGARSAGRTDGSTPGCSAKVLRPREMTGQRNLRTRKQRATRLPPLGTSAGNRR